MGNEGSVESGEGGRMVPGPPDSGQLLKPVNGAAAGAGKALEPTAAMNRLAGGGGPPSSPMQGSGNPYTKVVHDGPRQFQTSSIHQPQIQASSGGVVGNQSPGQHASRRNLQVDFSSCAGRTGRSPTVSPDRASAPTSPYSVPQIAPMPSSKLCPVCNTAELASVHGSPNFNKCTQCQMTVCNQCGFNPNPHLTGVKEWLCLNCQMQRALGIDMTTPRSKSQQQIHSPSHQPKTDPIPKTHLSAQPAPQLQSQTQTQPKIQPQAQTQASSGIQRQIVPTGPHQTGLHGQQAQKEAVQAGLQSGPKDLQRQRGVAFGPKNPETGVQLGKPPHPGAVPLPGLVKAQSQSDLGWGSPVRYGGQPERTRSAGSSPARQPPSQEAPPQDGLTKLFGFGASLLNQASTLISVDPLSGPSQQPSPVRNQSAQGSRVIFSDANTGARAGAPGTTKTGPGGVVLPKGSEAVLQQHSPVHHQKVPKQQQSQTHPGTAALQQHPSPMKQPQPDRRKPDITCPLCKTPFNVGTTEPPNYRACTQCHTQVCNLCGFNPTPHLLEKKEWLCLNCQTQRLMSGGLDPLPIPHSSPNRQPVGSPKHQQLSRQQQQGPKAMTPQQKPPVSQQSGPTAPMAKPGTDIKTPQLTPATATHTSITTTFIGEDHRNETAPKLEKESDFHTKPSERKKMTEPIQTLVKDDKKELQRSKYYEETSKTNSTNDLSRSPQSLSDTGYSSDGISSSQSEITGVIQEEELKLNERGVTGHHTPPSPSEFLKLESSMRPLLESKLSSEGERTKDNKREKDHIRKHRSRSISISPEDYDSDEDLEGIMEEEEEPTDWETKQELRSISALEGNIGQKKRGLESEEMTDEEFMRRQIMEMSADEENEDELEEEEDNDDEGYSYKKPKKPQKHISDSGKEKHRLTYHSNSFEEDSKTTSDVYKGSAEEDHMASQGGLRRFKTIELNNSNSYSRDIELNNDNDLSLDREPELEMESLTGSPEERSRGEYSSTLPPTTSSYSSGISPTSISSMEDDSDSSPSRRQRLEEAKQQRKARHRSHGPLLPTIEDSSEEDELREEEELLREQEKMREVEQHRIRSTARKTKRDKEELRAQRRRERSKTPPSNLSPIEDASPTEELRQAAEMEELHRSSCSEYSPSADSDGEGYEMPSKLYKSGSEYNLPTFMSLYSPTEKPQTTSSSDTITTTSSGKQLKSAEEVYEEMMRKAEMLQKQQKQQQQQQQSCSGQQYSTSSYQESDIRNRQEYEDEYDYADHDDIAYENEDAVDIYEEIRQTSQNISKQLDDQKEMDDSYSEKQLLDTGSAFAKLLEQSNALLTPGTSPTQLSAPVSFSETGTGGRIPDVRVTQHFSKDVTKDRLRNQAGKNGITPRVAATTIAAYGVYARDAVTVSHTSASQTVSTTQPNLYGRQTGNTTITTSSVANVSHKIAAITQAYNQNAVRKVAISKGVQMRDSSTSSESGTASIRGYMYHERSPPLSPTSSPTQSPSQSPSRRTSEFSTQTVSPSMLASAGNAYHTSPVMTQSTQTSQRNALPCLFQNSSQNSTFVMRTEEFEPTCSQRPSRVNTATSPLSSPTRFSRQSTFDDYSPPDSPPYVAPHQQSPHQSFYRSYKPAKVNVGTSMVTTASMYTHGSHSMDNISLCHISTVPGTSRIEHGQRFHSGSVVDLRTAMKPTPFIMTDHGMDLTSLATESQKYSGIIEGSPIRQSTTIQPLIMNLNTQEQQHIVTSTATTVSVTVAASMFMSQPKQPVLYCDPLENRVDLGKGMEPVVCLALNKSPPTDPSIPKIDARLEELSVQQEQLLKQQQKLQQQQQILEEQLQQHHSLQQQQAVSFAKVDSSSRQHVLKKDMVVTQTSTSTQVNVISPAITSDVYSHVFQQETGSMNLTNVKPHTMMVQMGGTAQGSTVTQLIKSEDNQDVMDLSGQIKSENQATCCDMVYNLPFGGSCVGVPFSRKTVLDETTEQTSTTQPQLYQQPDLYQDRQTYQNCAIKSYTLPFPRRLQPSMSEINLTEAGLLSYSANLDPHYQSSGELFTDTAKDGYEVGYSGMGLQYGSYTDLRQGDVAALPIRRYSSLTNISSDSGYFPGDWGEPNLAQYSATTAREISRMCAALNSMDRYSSNPDILQLATGRYSGPPFNVNLLQAPRHNLKYGSDGKPLSHSQTLTDLINARQASLRAMYPSAIRSVDGMIYSTINTPIASTVPITTQPGSVLQPLIRGVYRPYAAPNMTPVPLASLTRLSLAPRTGQQPFHYPTPNLVSLTTAKVTMAITTAQDTPLFLGRSSVSLSVAERATPTQPHSVPAHSTTSAPILMQMVVPVSQTDIPINLSLSKTTAKSQIQYQQPQGTPSAHSYLPVHGQSKTDQPSLSSQRGQSNTTVPGSFIPHQEKESEERLHQQQEQLLQLERERVEMEKMRQLRLQDELDWERAELQRDREKEHVLVQREIQELQTIKQQVLNQQQAEKEGQLILQREQLAQQKKQLDQIQSLQQQLQQQLEEQKRQKSLANTPHSGKAGKMNQPQELVPDVLYNDVKVFLRSASEMCLRNSEEQTGNRSMRKQRSMPRLQDGHEGEVTMFPLPQRLVNSSVQTDDEDGEERYLVSRRRRNRRSVDCSVQTDDDEDRAEWEQPVRRRRSRYSRHVSESGVDHKSEMPSFSTPAARATSSSIAVQTIRDCSCQTETDHLTQVSPSIHVTVPDPNKVEIVHYVSGPERTQKGQSLACQTDPETQPQSIVAPQINVATTVCPTSVQLVGSADQLSPSHQSVMMLARRRPDPLEFGYQQHLHNESLSSLIRQQPKSPQVLYSPVSPLSSPQHTIETSFSSSERLNKAHVTPQKKSSIGEPLQRHQALPRPMKNIQRSMSDPKPLSPTTDENTKARISFYQQQALQSQLAALQQSSLLRKVKRTLPSPPPEETLTMVAPNLSQMFVPSLSSFKGGSRLAAKTSLLKDLTHELKAVEQESSKLRKQQAELEEEEKEIDAKLRYLELGITQRKDTLVKERERREVTYLRCMGDSRDYMSDSELNNLRLTSAATSFEGNGLLTRPSTAPLSQFTCELNTAAQFPPTSSFMPYQYPQSLITAPTPQASTLPSTGFNQPPYPSVTQAQALPQPTPLQTYPTLSYQVPGTFPSQGFPMSQPPYPTDTSVPPPTQPSHPGFQHTLPPTGGTTYPTYSAPYPSQAPPYPVGQTSTYQPQADTLTFQQKPRQTSLADLEHNMPTNYEVVSNPTVTITAQDTSYSQSGLGPPYGQYSPAVASTYGPYSSSVSNTYGGSLTTSTSSVYAPYTTTSSSGYGQYTTTTANTYGYTVTTASSYGQYNTIVTNTYGQAPMSDYMHSVDSPSMYSSEGLYGSSSLEQNVSRNYVMIDDICDLTKEGMGTAPDSHRSEGHGRYGTDGLHTRGGSSCSRPEDERDADPYDQHHGRGKSTGSYQAQGTNPPSRVVGSSSMGGGSSYYYDDYRHSAPTRAAYRQKSLWPPAVMPSRRSKHRKQSTEQKISKFSPIEEAHDVEADLASYTMSTSATSGYGSGSHYHKLEDDIYGLRSTFDPPWGNYSDDRLYGYGRSRSAGYGMDKISSCERGYSSRSYEGGCRDQSYHSNYGHSAHPSLHSQYSEKEGSHLMTKLMGAGKAFNYPSNSYGSSHSLPDVQDHFRDLPRTYVYARDDMYIIDDIHCAVSDSEAYHLGQEETDWFEKPRDVRGSRHYGSNGHSSRRGHVKHTYHDYDEPPEDLWPQTDYGQSRHVSSREHRQHGSGSSGRHPSRHSDEPRSSRSSRSSKDPSMRHDSRSLSSSGRRGESRSQGYHSTDYSCDPSGQHHSSRSGKQSSQYQGSSSRKQQDHLSSSRQPGSLGPTQKGSGGPSSRQPSSSQSAIDGQQGQRSQLPQQGQTSATRPGLQTSVIGSAQPQLVQAQQLQSKPAQAGPMARQPTSAAQATPAAMKPEPVTAIGAKASPIQPPKTTQPPLTGIGSKAGPRPGGIGSAAAGQPGVDGESVLSKILPGGAAEQAGKLGDAISGFGKKFSSLW
ncbi:protein bassoon isoform X1 [Triplophysa dalaica]|uniref:protein bassoon isoform X1 n=1 Tax=Triplophysa dalaica TaxID=1582913 RepID=UPI0024DF358F|nr:protein bassoon isoform X1 [Triplophysa dalaica]XP_056628473.1 protein bassoon isoform X1 [Triplophysa dalaica]XP_056628474.1 protein bassoon isoform X1 [Triplophysa dalaica]